MEHSVHTHELTQHDTGRHIQGLHPTGMQMHFLAIGHHHHEGRHLRLRGPKGQAVVSFHAKGSPIQEEGILRGCSRAQVVAGRAMGKAAELAVDGEVIVPSLAALFPYKGGKIRRGQNVVTTFRLSVPCKTTINASPHPGLEHGASRHTA